MIGELFAQFEKAVDAVVSAGAACVPMDWGEKTTLCDPPNNTATVVNGVELPQIVLDQLRQAGFNPSWCNHYELEAAKRAAAVDCQVFDEPDADDFFDGLELDSEEEKSLTEKYTISPQNDIIERAMTFCERIKQQRTRQNGCQELFAVAYANTA